MWVQNIFFLLLINIINIPATQSFSPIKFLLISSSTPQFSDSSVKESFFLVQPLEYGTHMSRYWLYFSKNDVSQYYNSAEFPLIYRGRIRQWTNKIPGLLSSEKCIIYVNILIYIHPIGYYVLITKLCKIILNLVW